MYIYIYIYIYWHSRAFSEAASAVIIIVITVNINRLARGGGQSRLAGDLRDWESRVQTDSYTHEL